MFWTKTLAAAVVLVGSSAANAAPVRYAFDSPTFEFSLVSPDFVTEFDPPVDFAAAEMDFCVGGVLEGEQGRCHSVSFEPNFVSGDHDLILRTTFETVSVRQQIGFERGTFAMFGTFTPLGTLPGLLTISAAEETPVPEPSALLLIGLGAIGLAARRGRKDWQRIAAQAHLTRY